MTVNDSYEIVEVSGEYMAIPVGDAATSFNGIVTLSEAAAFLLKCMDTPKTTMELVDYLTTEYDVDKAIAKADVERFVSQLLEIGILNA